MSAAWPLTDCLSPASFPIFYPYILRNLIFRTGDELQSEFSSFACQGFERPLFELVIVLLLADVGVVDAALQHSVDQDRQFVCRGDGYPSVFRCGNRDGDKKRQARFGCE